MKKYCIVFILMFILKIDLWASLGVSSPSLSLNNAGVSFINKDCFNYLSNPALSALVADTSSLNLGYLSYNNDNSFDKGEFKSLGLSYNRKTKDFNVAFGIIAQKYVRKISDYEASNAGINISGSYGDRFKIASGVALNGYFYDHSSGVEEFFFDFGLNLSYDILRKKKLNDDLSFDLTASFGYAILNIGNTKSDNRNISIGYSLNADLNYAMKKNNFKAISIDWVADAKDYISESGLIGGIELFNDLILLKGNSNESVYSNRINVRSLAGYKIELFETFAFLNGVVREGGYKNNYGFVLSSAGIFKLINEVTDYSEALAWIQKNMDFRFSFTKFYAFNNDCNMYGLQLAYEL